MSPPAVTWWERWEVWSTTVRCWETWDTHVHWWNWTFSQLHWQSHLSVYWSLWTLSRWQISPSCQMSNSSILWFETRLAVRCNSPPWRSELKMTLICSTRSAERLLDERMNWSTHLTVCWPAPAALHTSSRILTGTPWLRNSVDNVPDECSLWPSGPVMYGEDGRLWWYPSRGVRRKRKAEESKEDGNKELVEEQRQRHTGWKELGAETIIDFSIGSAECIYHWFPHWHLRAWRTRRTAQMWLTNSTPLTRSEEENWDI